MATVATRGAAPELRLRRDRAQGLGFDDLAARAAATRGHEHGDVLAMP
jgi:hypothetical protein